MSRIIVFPRPTRSSTFHAMALERWRFGVARNLAGDEQGYLDALEDVRKFDEQAAAARVREERLRLQLEERRRMAAALDHLLATVQAGRAEP